MTWEPGAARELLARRLRVLRAARGWSQEVLAELAGLHRTYISGIERGGYSVSIDTLEKIAQAFGMSIEQLLAAKLDARWVSRNL